MFNWFYNWLYNPKYKVGRIIKFKPFGTYKERVGKIYKVEKFEREIWYWVEGYRTYLEEYEICGYHPDIKTIIESNYNV